MMNALSTGTSHPSDTSSPLMHLLLISCRSMAGCLKPHDSLWLAFVDPSHEHRWLSSFYKWQCLISNAFLVGAGFRGSDTASVLQIRKSDCAEPTGPSKLSLRSASTGITQRPVKVNWVMGVFPILCKSEMHFHLGKQISFATHLMCLSAEKDQCPLKVDETSDVGWECSVYPGGGAGVSNEWEIEIMPWNEKDHTHKHRKIWTYYLRGALVVQGRRCRRDHEDFLIFTSCQIGWDESESEGGNIAEAERKRVS